MKIEDIAKKLKKQWEPYHGGNCKMFSVGYDCECHLCLIDELLEIAIKASQQDDSTDTLNCGHDRKYIMYTKNGQFCSICNEPAYG